MEEKSSQAIVLNKSNVTRATNALLKHHRIENNKQKVNLVEYIYLQVALKTTPKTHATKSLTVILPNPIYSDTTKICIIVKGSANDYKEKLSSVPNIVKIISISKLKKDYKSVDARKKLFDGYDMFLAEKKIIPLLPSLLGKLFMKTLKIPIPIKLTKENVPDIVENAIRKTFFSYRAGTNFTIRVGKTDQSSEEVEENIMTISRAIVFLTVKDVTLVRKLNIKTPNSTSLPIYCSDPDSEFASLLSSDKDSEIEIKEEDD